MVPIKIEGEKLALRLENLAAWLDGWLASHEVFAFVLFTLALVPQLLGRASNRLLWFDEVFTAKIARLSPPDLWKALSQAIDLNPPGFYLLTGWTEKLLGGEGLISLRVVSMVAFWIACFCVYRFVRERCGALFGWLAALLLTVTPALDYAVEARAYSAVVGCCGVAMLCWRAADRSRLATLGLALTLALAISLHYYAGLLFLAFGAAELTRTFEQKKLNWINWLALFAGAAPLVAYVGLIRSASAYFKGFGVKPEAITPDFLYSQTVERAEIWLLPVWVLLAALTLAGMLRLTSTEEERTRIPLSETVLSIALMALPLVCWISAKLVVGQILLRYALSATVGFAVLSVFFVYAARLRFAPVLLVVLVIGGLLGARGAKQAISLRHRTPDDSTYRALASVAQQSDSPLLIGRCMEFVAMDYYMHGNMPNTYCMADVDKAYQDSRRDAVDRAVITLKQWFPMNAISPEPFLTEHRRFLLYVPTDDPVWIQKYVQQQGAEIVLKPAPGLERPLMEVHLPTLAR